MREATRIGLILIGAYVIVSSLGDASGITREVRTTDSSLFEALGTHVLAWSVTGLLPGVALILSSSFLAGLADGSAGEGVTLPDTEGLLAGGFALLGAFFFVTGVYSCVSSVGLMAIPAQDPPVPGLVMWMMLAQLPGALTKVVAGLALFFRSRRMAASVL